MDARNEGPTNIIKFYAEANDKSAVLIVLRENGRPTSLDQFATNAAAGLQRGGMQLTERHRVQLPAGDAERTTLTDTYRDDQGDFVTDHYVQYALVLTRAFRTSGYLLQFGVPDAITDETRATIEQIASTFRLL
jgi:hypothetical protein